MPPRGAAPLWLLLAVMLRAPEEAEATAEPSAPSAATGPWLAPPCTTVPPDTSSLTPTTEALHLDVPDDRAAFELYRATASKQPFSIRLRHDNVYIDGVAHFRGGQVRADATARCHP